MRDVTDNVTGELAGLEQKRGRGRPRKAHAMSNAERQAAFRARRRAQQPPIGSVTVTKMPVEVDAYDECRLEVEALRAELAEAHDTIDELNDELLPLRAMKQRLDEDALNGYAQRVTSNGNLAEIETLRSQLTVSEDDRHAALRLVSALQEKVAKLESKKSVTSSNDKSVTTQQWLALLGVACKSKTAKQQLAVGDSQAYRVVMSVLQGREFERLQDVVYGPDSSVAGARKA